MADGYPGKAASSLPVVGSQSFTVLSSPAEASDRPSGAKATARIVCVWLRLTSRSLPVARSHTRTVLEAFILLACIGIGQAQVLVSGGAGNQLAIRRECQCVNPAVVAGDLVMFFLLGHVPEPNRDVLASRGQQRAVRGKRQGQD